ncbi:hypothetical protein NUU61_007532 [Penicillium alfredii]|uniref:Uncharacterized protein n=1 Tax=Penicillium alfredii TaxID=1506179 RepID=A0A9W9F391_9EURO|nr:uncharacterized protein NUU61_007532 [Penicillium alfredii]KAJ5092662.1 hypothetical protein NUU61_007532 [Penicillium alfredii]
MITGRISWLLFAFTLTLWVETGRSLELQPMGSPVADHGRNLVRDDDFSGLDLLSVESFFWGGSEKGRSALGNLTLHMPGEAESIIAMEKFQPLLESSQCTKNSMTLNFKNERSYQYGQRIWKWVNDADDRTFVLVAGHGHCGWNKHRLPFIVSNVLFSDTKNTVTVTGKASDWKTVAHTYELLVGGHPSLAKRDASPSFSLDFNHPLPLSSKSVSVGDVEFTYDCEDCGTKGEFDFEFQLKTELLIPKGVSMSLSPRGVSANFNPRLGLSANFTDKKSDERELGRIPIDGISIPGGVLDLGPEVVFSWGYELGPVVGTAGVSTGVSIGLQDAAKLAIDLTSPDVSASGWKPTVSQKPVTVDASISAGVQLNAKATVELALEALGQGFEVGVNLEPFAGAKFNVAASSAGACPEDPKKHRFGVKIAPSLGVNLNVEASTAGNEEEPILSQAIASVTMPLPSMCTGFGSGPGRPDPSKPKKKPSSESSHGVTKSSEHAPTLALSSSSSPSPSESTPPPTATSHTTTLSTTLSRSAPSSSPSVHRGTHDS